MKCDESYITCTFTRKQCASLNFFCRVRREQKNVKRGKVGFVVVILMMMRMAMIKILRKK